MGFVYRKANKYLHYDEWTTHTGSHKTAEWVTNLNDATVFYTLPPYALRVEELKDAERLAARETRTVNLIVR